MLPKYTLSYVTDENLELARIEEYPDIFIVRKFYGPEENHFYEEVVEAFDEALKLAQDWVSFWR